MLQDYDKKRDFTRTPEPLPKTVIGKGPLTFVVHKHAARRLHYDLRLELDGVLKSWAMPAGPSLNPGIKHLAVMVEDHPLDYGSFEGVIPAGEYGAGEVIVWDSGTYSPAEGEQLYFEDRSRAEDIMRKGLEAGKISITLRGHKLNGSWALVRLHGKEKDWLLIKHRDEFASGRDILEENRSVVSNLTIEDLKAGRMPDPAPAGQKTPPADVPGAKPAPGGDPPASASVDELLSQLQEPGDNLSLAVEGHQISITHMDKALWPAVADRRAYTKRDLLIYLAKVSGYVLPHLKDRPLTMTRYPDGIYAEHFYQKHWTTGPLPEYVEFVNITERDDGRQEYLLCNNLATLLWLGQVADLELHTWFSRVNPLPERPDIARGRSRDEIADLATEYPDFIIFDMDPYLYSGKEKAGDEPELNRAAFDKTCEIALRLKEVLDKLRLSAFIKTSGKTGLHVHVPILRHFDFTAVRSAAESISRHLLERYPQDITLEWAVEKRRGKIFMDFNQNVRGKTLASVYSPRPTPEATVSTPLRWDELGKIYPTDFTIITVPERLAKIGDIWSGILDAKHDLKALIQRK